MSKKKRICQNCGGAIPESRQSGAKYCKDPCKARYHEKRLMKELLNDKATQKPDAEVEKTEMQVTKPVVNFHGELRGVIENKSVSETASVQSAPEKDVLYADFNKILPVQMQEETPEYKAAFAKKMEAENILNKILSTLEKGREHLKKLETKLNSLSLPTKRKLDWSFPDAELFYDNEEMKYLEKVYQAEKEKPALEKEITDLKQLEAKAEKQALVPAKQKLKEAEDILKNTPQYKEVKQEKPTPLPSILEAVKKNKIQHEEKAETVSNDVKHKDEQPVMSNNSRIISVKQLKEMQTKNLDFQGRWREFFGTPATIFHLVVHGNPGGGKSTFCFQFANYLAENHGKTIYISGEEGFSPTLKKKAEETHSDSSNLFFANFKTATEIKEHIENIYPFIVIDSLNNMGIDAEGLRDLREHFPNSTFITICQSTKDGKMRGSQEIVHDADIVVSVVKPIAKTSKNRFFESEMEYYIFPKKENKTETKKPEKKQMEMLRNVI